MIRPSPVNAQLKAPPAELLSFLADYFEGDRVRISPPQRNLLFDQGVTSIVLHRAGRFQVELIVVAPGVKIPEHLHEDVDVIEVAIAGGIDLWVADVRAGYVREPRADGKMRDLGRYVSIAADAWHCGNAGPDGACFLSVQCWREGVTPSHVGQNWRGQRMGQQEPTP